MKKLIFLSIVLLAIALPAMAQQDAYFAKDSSKIALRMAYDDYKDLYDSRDYSHCIGDPYSPAAVGIASFFITGLGQMIIGDGGRGTWMLLGDIALVAAGISVAALTSTKDASGKSVPSTGGSIGLVCCWSAALGLNIWSICDVVKRAKIKNLYYRDCEKLKYSSLDVKLMPDVALVPIGQDIKPVAGMTLSVSF